MFPSSYLRTFDSALLRKKEKQRNKVAGVKLRLVSFLGVTLDMMKWELQASVSELLGGMEEGAKKHQIVNTRLSMFTRS